MTDRPNRRRPSGPDTAAAQGDAWSALRARYGAGLSGRRLLSAAIRGEVPGGAAVLEATALARGATKWGDATHAQIATHLGDAAAALEAAGWTDAAADSRRLAALSTGLAATAGSAANEPRAAELRAGLSALRDRLVERLLEPRA